MLGGEKAENFDMSTLWDSDEDTRSLKSLILFGLKGMAAYAYHARVLGKTDAFGKVFNVGLYRKDAEKRFIAEVLTQYKEEPYYRSMVESAARKQISLRNKTTFPRIVWAAFLDSPLHNVLRKFPGLRPAVRGLKRMLRSSHTGKHTQNV